MNPATYILPENQRRARADKVLATAFPDHSRVAWQRAFDAGLVQLAGKPIKRNQTLNPGDAITYTFPEVVELDLRPVDIPLDVVFEDEHMLAINKASGMVVHPGAGTSEDTLVHALLAHCGDTLSGVGGVARPGIVHRLDRETSGLILVAKTDAAHRGLATQFAERELSKSYLALGDGAPDLLSGSLRQPIGRHPTNRTKMAVVEVERGGRDAHTDWELVERFRKMATLFRCDIHTGRTHQIRVHLKTLGHTLWGDRTYGWKPHPSDPIEPTRVMLHAEHLVVRHPITAEVLDLRAPLPADFEDVLKALRETTNRR